MIVEQQPNTVKSHGITLTKGFSIQAEGMAFIQNILRSQIYENPIKCLLTEISINSVDSHIEAGKGHIPITVTLPSCFDSTLKIRDEGVGMSQETVLSLYSYLGSSSKRNSNLVTGFLGIGKISVLSYQSSFILTSRHDGTKNTYNIYVDSEGLTQIALLSSEKTDEGNGVEVVCAVKDGDIQNFHNAAQQVFRFFKVKPIVHGATFTYDTDKPIIEGKGWRILGKGKQAVATMGNMAYNLDAHALALNDSNISAAFSCGLEIDFELGSLDVTASREALNCSPKTKKAIGDRMVSIIAEVTKELSTRFNGCKTLFEAHKLYGEIFNFSSNLYELRNLVKSGIIFNGQAVTSDDLYFTSVTDGSYSMRRFEKSWRGTRIKAREVGQIECDGQTILVLNDLKVSNGIVNRVYNLVNADKRVYVFSYRDDAAKKAFLKDSGLLESEFTLLSTLPKVSLGNGSTYTKNAKHTSAVFVYDEAFAKTQTSSWRNHGKKSDYWTQETLDLKNDSGVYVILDGFEYADKGGSMTFPKSLYSTLESLKAFGITPKVYGIKVKHEDTVKKNKALVNLWDYISRELTAYFDKNNISQKLANRVEYDSNRPDWLDFILKNGSKADPKSDFAQAAVTFAYMKCDKDKKELDAAVNWKDYIKTLEPEHNLGKLIAKVGKKYPLFEMISFYRDTKADAILDYVKMVG